MNIEHKLVQDDRIIVVYDRDCPFCSAYIRMIRLCEAVGRPTLVNARERPELVKALAESGVNLDEGMAVYYQGRLFVGSDAMTLLAALSTPVGFANQFTAAVLRRRSLARALYPLFRAGRNLLLKLRNKPQLTCRRL